MKSICTARMANSKLRSATADMDASGLLLAYGLATAVAWGASRSARTCRKASHESGMFGGRQSLAKHLRHALAIEMQQCNRVEPQSRENLRTKDPIISGCQILEVPLARDKPVDTALAQ